MEYRDQILNGNLALPGASTIEAKLGTDILEVTERMWSALWHNFVTNEGRISATYWYTEFNNPKAFNTIIMSLSKHGWIHSLASAERNWADIGINLEHLLSFVTQTEIDDMRASYKFAQYRPRASLSTKTDLVRLNGKTQRTGIVREGFMKAGNSRFKYDLDYLEAYKDIIKQNLTKSMDKIREMNPNMRASHADYDAISIDILDFLSTTNQSFTRGNCVADSRGRAISSSLSKVANPISCKDFRALLTME